MSNWKQLLIPKPKQVYLLSTRHKAVVIIVGEADSMSGACTHNLGWCATDGLLGCQVPYHHTEEFTQHINKGLYIHNFYMHHLNCCSLFVLLHTCHHPPHPEKPGSYHLGKMPVLAPSPCAGQILPAWTFSQNPTESHQPVNKNADMKIHCTSCLVANNAVNASKIMA